jgi:alpha-beta hydrolase superfamily lysophospholipase
LETCTFLSKDGTSLHGQFFPAKKKARAGALVVHGYNDHGGRYLELSNLLSDANISVLAVDVRGHGRSSGQRGHVLRFAEYLDDMDAALGELATRVGPDLPFMVVGHSHGALILLRYLSDPERAPARVKAAIFASPYLGLKMPVPSWKTGAARLASKLVPALSLPAPIPAAFLTSDLKKQAERKTDTLCHDVASARWFTEVEATWQWLQENVHKLAVPSLWLVAGGDRVADPERARALRGKVQAPARYTEFEGFEHEVFNEVERAQAFERLLDFAREHFPE